MEEKDWLSEIDWKYYQKKISKDIENSFYDTIDSSYKTSKYPYDSKEKIYKDEYERSKRELVKTQQIARENDIRALEAENTLDILTDGNEPMQRALIQQDPENIRYIKKPYVSIQIEAITADPNCFNLINNPAQETIDTYRIIK